MIKQNHILRFEKFLQFDSLVHGFSTRFFGDLRPSHPEYKKSLQKFSKALGIDPEKLVRMNQVHGNTVQFVSEKDSGQVIDKTDGMITNLENISLGVVTADCIPLLFYDPQKKIVAAVHAGWRGLFAEIIKETISTFVAKGSDAKDLVVGIGPCIRACCYNIPKERADEYLAKFPEWKDFIIQRDEKLFFDLPAVAKYQLVSAGVLQTNIEDGDYCTFDHEDIYSYRREGKDFGEMMGIIGIR